MSSSNATAEHMAPYIRLPPGVTTNRQDITYLREGHTLEKHRDVIGRTEGRFHAQYQKFILQRTMDEEEMERVLRDPGVEKVVQVTREMERAARKEDRTVVTYPAAKAAPGYFVNFIDEAYTVEDHFARIGERFDNVRAFTEGGYFVDVPDSKLEKILADPNVYIVEQNTYTRLHEDPLPE